MKIDKTGNIEFEFFKHEYNILKELNERLVEKIEFYNNLAKKSEIAKDRAQNENRRLRALLRANDIDPSEKI